MQDKFRNQYYVNAVFNRLVNSTWPSALVAREIENRQFEYVTDLAIAEIFAAEG